MKRGTRDKEKSGCEAVFGWSGVGKTRNWRGTEMDEKELLKIIEAGARSGNKKQHTKKMRDFNMAKSSTIRILETEANKIGDLFGRLMVDLFLSLGYDECRINIHKSGREIDLEGRHRTENRRVIAECKATGDKIGGDDINKFVGALDVERRKEPKSKIAGYFISLSGFKETAIEQEKDAGGERVTLLVENRIIEELIKGRIIVPLEKAIGRAGRCAAEEPAGLKEEAKCELLAHDIGWIWAVYFTRNKQRTHFALIHADGEALAPALPKG